LMSLSAISSFANGGVQRYFLKAAGVAVVILGIFNIQSGLTLTATATGGLPLGATNGQAPATAAATDFVPVVDGKQIVDMKIVGYQYVPHQFNVVQGIPVEWRVDAQQAAGCARVLLAPKAGVRKLLPFGTTLIDFTPQDVGEIRFNCSMGMTTPGSKITVLPPPAGKVAAAAPTKVASDAAPGPVAQTAPAPSQQPASAAAPAPAPTPAPAKSAEPAAASAPAKAAAPSEGLGSSAGLRASIEQIVKDYLMQHPEVIQDALAALQARQEAEEAKAHEAAVKEQSATVFGSPHQVVLGNPQGKVTMVEFFDYNCAYCKRAMSDMLTLLKNDNSLRVVLKEFPVLGEGSVEAARVAVAVRMQDPTGQKYLEFHQKLLGNRGEANAERALAVAKDVGLDMDRLQRDMASPEVKATIDENVKLGDTLGITGTPTYVIGSEVVTGAVGLDALQEKIKAIQSKTNG